MMDIQPLYFEGDRKTYTQLDSDMIVGSFVYYEYLQSQDWVCLLLDHRSPEPTEPSRKIPLIDGTGNHDDLIYECVGFVVSNWRKGNKVAILCASGANRAPGIAAASWLVARRGTSIYGINEWLRAHRKEVGHYNGTKSEIEFAIDRLVNLTVKPEHEHFFK